jgi:hypothetical protein
VFINLETDPHILYSSPCRACVNLPLPIAFGLPLMSALGHSSDSRSHLRWDTPRTPTHVHAGMLLGLYSELRSRVLPIHLYPPLRNTRPLHCNPVLTDTNPTRSSVSIHAKVLGTPLRCPLRCLLGHLLGHPCLNSSYKSEPMPSDPIRTSLLVRITIRTLAIQLRLGICSDIRVSLCLTSSSLCLWGPLGPPSLSALRVLRRSEPLVTL